MPTRRPLVPINEPGVTREQTEAERFEILKLALLVPKQLAEMLCAINLDAIIRRDGLSKVHARAVVDPEEIEHVRFLVTTSWLSMLITAIERDRGVTRLGEDLLPVDVSCFQATVGNQELQAASGYEAITEFLRTELGDHQPYAIYLSFAANVCLKLEDNGPLQLPRGLTLTCDAVGYFVQRT